MFITSRIMFMTPESVADDGADGDEHATKSTWIATAPSAELTKNRLRLFIVDDSPEVLTSGHAAILGT